MLLKTHLLRPLHGGDGQRPFQCGLLHALIIQLHFSLQVFYLRTTIAVAYAVGYDTLADDGGVWKQLENNL